MNNRKNERRFKLKMGIKEESGGKYIEKEKKFCEKGREQRKGKYLEKENVRC